MVLLSNYTDKEFDLWFWSQEYNTGKTSIPEIGKYPLFMQFALYVEFFKAQGIYLMCYPHKDMIEIWTRQDRSDLQTVYSYPNQGIELSYRWALLTASNLFDKNNGDTL